ncbi:type I restriction enzyme HsdR N-terminal domain-containing protein [Dokdonia sp. Hel_I_53]|uniref:type I restriction enzyme HsdR N-terminal domain-containing protein n=1 Tax=Dokdonia sp. Hel_I_53 TaxID=1566287 RepID=UPI001198EA50|nr:type I restriction enzyme HsdR N-terminal domain-containing protein [Dokdonia sp. Hel_I_53]TVZ51091.1 type I restriction and modification enzyme subunit R-like protein [Dokdonia sp. Hel_I_53]
MQQLAFPAYSFRLKNSENKTFIFDVVRKRFLVLTPEEWVRQHVIQFLLQDKKYPLSLLNVEKQIKVGTTRKRYDIVLYKPDGSLFLIVECKAPSVTIDQKAFDQIARYNLTLNADYLMVTNGLLHYYCELNYRHEMYHFLRSLPDFKHS